MSKDALLLHVLLHTQVDLSRKPWSVTDANKLQDLENALWGTATRNLQRRRVIRVMHALLRSLTRMALSTGTHICQFNMTDAISRYITCWRTARHATCFSHMQCDMLCVALPL